MADKIEVQYQGILPPMQGAIAAVAVTTTPIVVDLTTLPSGLAARAGESQAGQTNVIGKYVRIIADGGTIYHAFGNNFTTLANINVGSASAVNANTGALTLTNAECFPIESATYQDELVSGASTNAVGTPSAQIPRGGASVCRYVALVMATGTATARFFQSST